MKSIKLLQCAGEIEGLARDGEVGECLRDIARFVRGLAGSEINDDFFDTEWGLVGAAADGRTTFVQAKPMGDTERKYLTCILLKNIGGTLDATDIRTQAFLNITPSRADHAIDRDVGRDPTKD